MATRTIPKSTRSGEVTTPSISIPTGISQIVITYNMDAADLAVPARTITSTIEHSTDGGTVWRTVVSSAWTGAVGNALPPRIVYNPNDLSRTLARLRVDLGAVPLSIGATFTAV